MIKHYCDSCGKDVIEYINKDKEISIGCHDNINRGFFIELQIDFQLKSRYNDESTKADICKDCAKILINKYTENIKD